jgi:hypothetical protein
VKAPERFSQSWDYLREVASKTCGLTDFGRDDYSTGLSVLLESMDVDPRFTPQGREMAWNTNVRTMAHFGLTPAMIRERHSAYIKKFGLGA